MRFREAFLIEALGGALVIALLLLAQHAKAQGVTYTPCYPTNTGYVCGPSGRAIEPPDVWPHGVLRYGQSPGWPQWHDALDRPYADDYPGYAPLDPTVHDQLDRIERKLDELER